MKKGRKRLELAGRKFGKLLVLDVDEDRTLLCGNKYIYWKCLCDCGNIFSAQASDLASGHTKSCAKKCFWKNQLPEGVLFDPEDFLLIDSINWHIEQGYVINTPGAGKTKIRLHRLIMRALPDEEVDHINRNRLDNRKSNLRLVPSRINAQNLPDIRKNNTSGYRGVWYSKKLGKWAASARLYYKRHHLGYYDTAEEAHTVVSAWRLKNMEAYYSLEQKEDG